METIEGVPGTQVGWAKVLTIDNTDRKKRVNSLLAFRLTDFLITEKVDVGMSGCFSRIAKQCCRS